MASTGSTTVDPVTGEISYQHDGVSTTDDSFTYTVADDLGLPSNVATVTIEVNLAPIAINDSAAVDASESIDIVVLTNDSDDNDLLDETSVVIVTDATEGVTNVDPVTGEVSYSHGGGTVVTTDSFTYTVADTNGLISGIATVTINIDTSFTLPTIGLVAHFETDVGLTSTGDVIISWDDQSATANSLSGLGSVEVLANGLNGNPVVDFDGIDDALTSVGAANLPLTNDDRTVVLVVNYDGLGNGGFTYGVASGNQAFGLQVSDTGVLAIHGSGAGNNFSSASTGTGSGWIVQSAILDAGTFNHYSDDQVIDTQAHTFATSAGTMDFGTDFTQAEFVDMQVAAMLVYSRALSAAELTEVLGYFNDKYDLANN